MTPSGIEPATFRFIAQLHCHILGLKFFRALPVILVSFEWNFNIRGRFSKNTRMWIFTKTRPSDSRVVHADGRTDMTKPISGVPRNFVRGRSTNSV